MFLHRAKPASLAVIPALLAFAPVAAAGQTAPPATTRIVGDVVPGAEWTETTPESVGYSSAKLEALRGWVKTQDTTSMMEVVQGRVIFSYGDVSHTSNVASARKSVLGMLYGKYVGDDTIDLGKTVKQLGLDDTDPFLPIEADATLVQLLASRSGIYLPVQKVPPETLPGFDQGKYMPRRRRSHRDAGLRSLEAKEGAGARQCASVVCHVALHAGYGAAWALDARLGCVEREDHLPR